MATAEFSVKLACLETDRELWFYVSVSSVARKGFFQDLQTLTKYLLFDS
jgi:hypothetical protein